MGLYKGTPPLSGRMATLWCLSEIRESAVIEFGCMGHMAYGRTFLHKLGSSGAKLFSTHISETDIAMGDTKRLERAIASVTKDASIKTIFLLPSSVPEVIGTDLDAITKELSPQFPKVQIIPMTAGGFDVEGNKGIAHTLLQLAQRMPKQDVAAEKNTCNIIGSCADMFRFKADCAELSRMVKSAFSMDTLCTMTSNTNVSELEQLGRAQINLVIRREGEQAAQYLQERFQTPYIVARPYGLESSMQWLERIAKICELQIDKSFQRKETAQALEQIQTIRAVMARFLHVHPQESKLTLVGHADVIEGIAQYGKEAFGFQECYCFCDSADMADANTPFASEEIFERVSREENGFLMGSEELLSKAKRAAHLQISNPSKSWHHAYEPPLVGIRGAVNLAIIWLNEIANRAD